MLEQPEKKKIRALAAKNNRGSLFSFQFAPHAAGYGSSTFLTLHTTSELGLIIWNICFQMLIYMLFNWLVSNRWLARSNELHDSDTTYKSSMCIWSFRGFQTRNCSLHNWCTLLCLPKHSLLSSTGPAFVLYLSIFSFYLCWVPHCHC